MPLERRKLPVIGILLIVCPLFLSACQPETEERPPVAVSQITSPPATPEMPPLYCRIGRGTALFGHRWDAFSDTLFTLNRGASVNLKISRARDNEAMTIQALFDGSGQKIIFCPFLDVPQHKPIACASIYALEEDLREGIKRTFDIPAALRGGFITCAYSREKLRSLSVPPGRGQ